MRFNERRGRSSVTYLLMPSKISFFSIVLLLLLPLLFLGTYYLVHDDIICIVEGGGVANVNGYYAALGGLYVKRGSPRKNQPDVFDIFGMRRQDLTSSFSTISLWANNMWTINQQRTPMYSNTPIDPAEYIYNPPPTGWVAVAEAGVELGKGNGTPPVVKYCRGSLANSPSISSTRNASNIQMLLQKPISTLFLIIIFYIAYWLWSTRTEVEAVAYSYDAVVNLGEYWRVVTASLSHFDLMHLGFNTMSLYNLAELELVYGSVEYAYLSVDLIFITMAISTVIFYVLITYYGRADLVYQQGIGYSCVIFAWMVAASVRMNQFCPIFFFPSFCFTTYFIPIPGMTGLPVNIGPIILLFLTKLIIPRSSFIGHLSGIVIGYPLAWNLLDWMNPPLFLALASAFCIYGRKLFVWRFPGYESSSHPINFSDFVSPAQLTYHRWLKWIMYLLAIVTPFCVWYYGTLQFFSRFIFVFLVWTSLHARQCMWLTEVPGVLNDCVTLISLTAVLALTLALTDFATLGASAGAWVMIVSLTSSVTTWVSIVVIGVMFILDCAVLLLLIFMLQDTREAQHWLQRLKLDAQALQQDPVYAAISRLLAPSEAPTAFPIFGGNSHRLNATSSGPQAAVRAGPPTAGVGASVGYSALPLHETSVHNPNPNHIQQSPTAAGKAATSSAKFGGNGGSNGSVPTINL